MRDSVRCFVAIEIPEELKKKLAKLSSELNIEGVKPVKQENLHITLKFLGNVQSGKLGEIEKTLREIRFKKFQIQLKGIGVFPNDNYIRVVWVGCENEELEKLAETINDVLAPSFKKEPFSAHLTIARVKRKLDLHGFLNKHSDEYFGEFEVSSFELKMSELSKEGPKYSTLAVFKATD